MKLENFFLKKFLLIKSKVSSLSIVVSSEFFWVIIFNVLIILFSGETFDDLNFFCLYEFEDELLKVVKKHKFLIGIFFCFNFTGIVFMFIEELSNFIDEYLFDSFILIIFL